MKKNTHGGARQGSGRHPKKEPTGVFYATFTLYFLDKVKMYRKEIKALILAYIRFKEQGEGNFFFNYYEKK